MTSDDDPAYIAASEWQAEQEHLDALSAEAEAEAADRAQREQSATYDDFTGA